MIDRYNVFIFDLDNTLIDENTYLFEAYREMALYVEQEYGNPETQVSLDFLKRTYTQEGRKQLLDKYISFANLPATAMDELLTIMRTVKLEAKLILIPGVHELMRSLIHQQKKICIATNGNKQQQQNKVSQIHWDGIDPTVIPVYFASDHQPKPSPEIIYAIMREQQLNPSEILFVGDSETDQLCAQQAGVDFCFISSLLSYLNT
jgi:HAD superfamily hydrolase (TIGR01549 family)